MQSGMFSNQVRRWFVIPLWKRILAAMILGVVAGFLLGDATQSIRWVGDLFIRLIQMAVVPLIFFTIVAGLVSMGDPARLGRMGVKTLGIFMFTSVPAITIAIMLALLIAPGVGVDLSGATPEVLGEPMSMGQRLMQIVPTNPVNALANGDILAVIFFSLLLGTSILVVGEPARPLADVFEAGSTVILRLIYWIMEFAPFGVFALIAWVTGTQGFSTLLDVTGLVVTVFLTAALHLLLVHGSLVRFVAKLSPRQFFRNAKNAMLVAFSTSSSSATLPVTMAVAEDNMGIKPVVASTVLPLGATINMDGTAAYVSIVTLFAAQAFGVDLGFADYLIIALIAALVAIGTASIPSASLFLIAAIMDAVGMTPGQIAIVVGFILPFDRPLDMVRTCVNVTGDLSVATCVARWENELDEDVFNQKNP